MKKPIIPDGLISRAVKAAIELREQLLNIGTPADEADRLVGQDLKAAWQASSKRGDDETWFYHCPKCYDSGVVNVSASYMEHKRLRQFYGPSAASQPYMQPCDPCAYRERVREMRNQSKETARVA